FMHLFNVQGLIVFAVALFVVKILHELGHAYVAKAYGCRVPVIGLALLVLWPVFYTDTTDAWRLTDKRHRLRIAMAGMAVEMTVAIIALLAWSLVPDGVMRSILFVLATTTWVMSLLINLNPLMRFDGYYLLSDWLSIPNLESRSQALARWWLREKLFSFNLPAPEPVNKGMIAFAVAVWCYRFLLFLGIALLVFNLVFKALGIILFIAEIGYFILAPIYREITMWHALKQHFKFNLSTLRTTAIFCVLTGLFFIPWQGVVEAPALLSYYNQPVYAPLSGQVQALSVRNDMPVRKGEALLRIDSPVLEHDLKQSKMRYEELQQQRFAAGLTAANLDKTLVAATALVSQNRRIHSLTAKLQRQEIRAPFAGKVVDTRVDLQQGMWIKEGEPLFVIVDPDRFTLVAYVAEADLGRINAGHTGVFFADGGGIEPVAVSIKEIEALGISELREPELASLFGGGVAVRENEDGQMIPVNATYRLHLQPEAEFKLLQRELRGVVNLDSAAESLAKRVYRRFMAILIRESDF
ncbi:MAG: HlyD family efflux transporter periplasmic adaptor subunit, partial [Gammaproteobacteria bacterium]|nr:HlyD family efflux transporter periplasmic adaptor subunit [Gammaproteobacteria bacterium]